MSASTGPPRRPGWLSSFVKRRKMRDPETRNPMHHSYYPTTASADSRPEYLLTRTRAQRVHDDARAAGRRQLDS